jgi:amino acid adenylation domain-containing protein
MNVSRDIGRRSALLRKLRDAEPETAATVSPIQRRPDAVNAPLSFSQERFWFLDRLAPGNPFYVESMAVPVPAGAIDPPVLEQAINIVVGRHEVLRTRFTEQKDGAVQIVLPDLHVPLQIADLSTLPAEQREAEATQLLQYNAILPFDLSRPPLLRFLLIKHVTADEIFAMAVHHIITDGWSMRILSREINEVASALTAGRPPTLPLLPIQYADFAFWQRQSVDEGSDPAMDYWLEQLSDLPALALPLDRPRPRVLGFKGAHRDVSLPANVSAGARVLAAREGATLFMVALAAFAAVLGRHSAQEDIVIGTPVVGRSRAELEPLIGLFLNTVVLKIRLSGDPTFRELLARVRKVAVAAFDRQHVPFERIVEKLEPERDLGRNPLFQVLFQVFTPHDEKVSAAKEQGETISVDRGVAILDLAVHLWEEPKGIKGRLEYSTELFEDITIQKLFQHFVRFLKAALAAPFRPISEIEMLSEAERAEAMETARGQRVAHNVEPTLPEAFGRCVGATPDAVALVERDKGTTYAELDGRMRNIAAALAGLGVGRGDRVVICLDRSVDAVAAMLATMRLGAAYVPIDPGYPKERIRFVIDDADAKAVVTIAAYRKKARFAELLVLDEAPLPDRPLPPLALSPLDLAYLVYTSGSTGRPKGVMGTHEATMNRFAWMWRQFHFAENEFTCLKTAMAFVDSVWEMFGPLLAGVPSVILSDEEARDPAALRAQLAEHKVTRLLVVPSLLRVMLDARIDLESLPHLRRVFTSGEQLTTDLLERVARAAPTLELINLYGSSEVAGDVTATKPLVATDDAAVPIGHPLDNCEAYILDQHMRLVPRGALGLLYIGGLNLARGYFRQPAMTAERFVPNPFSSEPGARLFATGDLVRVDPTGALVYEGRADHQVKIRGHRVELGEIEAVLQSHPEVAQAVVTTTDDGAGGRLHAWLTSAVQTPPRDDAIRRFLAERLPAYMIPSSFLVLDAFPLLPNGKLDRRALEDREPDDVAALVTPETDTEIAVAALWSALLRRPTIGANDNFFDIGGHSLLATRLVTAIGDRFDMELPLTAVFLYPTLRELAGEIERILLAEIETLSETEIQPFLHQNPDSRGIQP